jgi:LPXTG-motif cell wall-anchored protein
VFSITAGALPAGLTLDDSSGVVSGTPVTAGAFSFTVTATNSSGTVSETYAGTIEAQLAATGPQSTPLLELALALMLVGGALVLVRRRFA